MTLYARSDVCSIAIPVSSGGCGAQHTRKVTRGVPDKVWALNCPPCESYLRGDRKAKILRYQTDKKTGQVIRQERVADADPMWSSTPDTIPLSPDQEATHHLRVERGEQQLRALESIATLVKAGIDFRNRPDVLFFLRENQLPEDILQGSVLCADDHPNPAGVRFCNECGISMAAKGAISPGGDDGNEGGSVDLSRLHVQSLRKMARDRGLPDKGSKDDLIQRLAA
jgi:hypothetical protein